VRWASLSRAVATVEAMSVARIQPRISPTASPSHCQSIIPPRETSWIESGINRLTQLSGEGTASSAVTPSTPPAPVPVPAGWGGRAEGATVCAQAPTLARSTSAAVIQGGRLVMAALYSASGWQAHRRKITAEEMCLMGWEKQHMTPG
jgi:hypothetical protein